MRQISKRLVKLFTFIFLIALGACSGEFSRDDLIGVYILNTGSAADTLELKRNGEYVNIYQEKDSAKETVTGKWELERTYYSQVVVLDNFHPLPEKSATRNGFYLLEPTRFLGSIRLVRDADLNEFYEKQ